MLSIIHQQLNNELADGDVFIVMSKDHRLIRLFSYDKRSYSLYEKRFVPAYKFMHVEFENDLPVHKINWEDVVLLLRGFSGALGGSLFRYVQRGKIKTVVRTYGHSSS